MFGRYAAAVRVFVVAVAFLVAALAPAVAFASFTPPPLRGHVVDQAGALEPQQVRSLDRKLDQARRQIGYAIVVYILPQLPEGMSIEDVGYTAGNAWGVGSKAGDDGVILLASLAEHKLRIETGKGAGGALTDIGSSRINREVIGPLMKEGRTYEAMDRGADAIIKELAESTPAGTNEPGRSPSASRRGSKHPPAAPVAQGPADYLKLGVIALLVVGVIVLAIVSPAFREMLFWILLFGRFGGGGGGGGGRNDRDSGSGYGGGGGSFGGGGSSDDY